MKEQMRKLKIVVALMLVVAISVIGIDCNRKTARATVQQGKPVKVAVFLLDFTDDLISDIRRNLEDVQKTNSGKVEYTFYDSKSSEEIQNENLDKVLSEGVDLILLNIVNRGDAEGVINRIKEVNIPVILFNREPVTPVPIQSYNRALYIGSDPKQDGILQGKMLVDTWNASRGNIDKNRDEKMQYVMLQGESDNGEAIDRTKYSVSTIEKAGIKTQEIAIEVCNWREDLAYNATKKLLSKYKSQIEVIIANDDTMAIGAIKALQEIGFNNGNKEKTIPVVGVDITEKAKEFIEKGYMLGSVLQDPKAYAESLYDVGMNLVNKRNPVEGTQYKLDETGVAIRIPKTEVFYKNIYL
jgi:methyl-galactoside transport system substrate-binding protein